MRLLLKNVVSITGCQVGSLPDLSEHSRVTFLVRMLAGQMFDQNILDISVLDVGLVALLHYVVAEPASLPIKDGPDVVGLAHHTDGRILASAVGVTAA